MKQKLLLALGVLLVCGLALTGCENGSTDDEIETPVPKSLTIEDIVIADLGESGIVVGVKPTSTHANDNVALGYETVSGSGTVTITMALKNKPQSVEFEYDEDEADWTGSGGYYLFVWESQDGTFDDTPEWYTPLKVNFQTGETTVNWSSLLDYTDQKRVTITNITTLTGLFGVFVFAEIPQGGNTFPQMTAVRYGEISENSLSVALTVPNNNTYENPGNPWRGDGDYYVMIAPVSSGSINMDGAFVFTDSGSTPAKTSFTAPLVSLDIDKFKAVAELSQ